MPWHRRPEPHTGSPDGRRELVNTYPTASEELLLDTQPATMAGQYVHRRYVHNKQIQWLLVDYSLSRWRNTLYPVTGARGFRWNLRGPATRIPARLIYRDRDALRHANFDRSTAICPS